MWCPVIPCTGLCLIACLESVLNLEFPLNLVTVSTFLNLASITWHYSRDPQACLTARARFPSVLGSGNKNWRQITLPPKKAPKHPCWARAQVRQCWRMAKWGKQDQTREGAGEHTLEERGRGLWSLLSQCWGQAHQLRLARWQRWGLCLFSFSISSSLSKWLKAMDYYLPQSSKQILTNDSAVEGPKGEHWGELNRSLEKLFYKLT